MSTLNKVILIGNLGHDPSCKITDTGVEIANLSLATSEKWKDNNGEYQERTEWHDITFFGRAAEICKNYLTKGDKVCVEGSLKTETYTNKDGQEVTRTKITGRGLTMLSNKHSNKPDRTQKPKPEPKKQEDLDVADFTEDDLPF